MDEWLLQHPDYELSELSKADLARSGFRGEHLKHGLGELLAAVREGRLTNKDVILVEAVDRIGRMPSLDMFRLITEIVASGVTIITLEDGQEYSEEALNNNAGSLYILIGKIQQAHNYSEQLSRRVKQSIEAKRSRALRGESVRMKTPIWLTSDGLLKEPQATWIRHAVEMYLDGKGTRAIAIELAENCEEFSKVHPKSIKRWLSSPALVGTWENKGEPIEGVFEELIDHSVFDRVQSEMVRRRRAVLAENSYLLAGFVKCSNCGKSFHFRRKRYKDGVILYANCSSYLKRGAQSCDNNKTWPYEALLHIFSQSSADFVQLGAVEDQLDIQSVEVARLCHQRDALRNALATLLGPLDPEDQELPIIADKIASLSREVRSVEGKIARLRALEEKALPAIEEYGSDLYRMAEERIASEGLEEAAIRRLAERSNYAISVLRETARVRHPNGLDLVYCLLKRSTKNACYYIQRYDLSGHEVGDPDALIRELDLRPAYYAVSREGVLAEAESLNQLEDLLAKRDSSSELIADFASHFELTK